MFLAAYSVSKLDILTWLLRSLASAHVRNKIRMMVRPLFVDMYGKCRYFTDRTENELIISQVYPTLWLGGIFSSDKKQPMSIQLTKSSLMHQKSHDTHFSAIFLCSCHHCDFGSFLLELSAYTSIKSSCLHTQKMPQSTGLSLVSWALLQPWFLVVSRPFDSRWELSPL